MTDRKLFLLKLSRNIVIGLLLIFLSVDREPVSAQASEGLKVSYLAEVPRGTEVTLLFMSGERVTGKLMNVKTEHDVLVLIVGKEDGKQDVGCYKAVALAGVEWTENEGQWK